MFILLADANLHYDQYLDRTVIRIYASYSGINPYITVLLWNRVKNFLKKATRPFPLLWTQFSVRKYWTDYPNETFWKCDEKTFLKLVWYIIDIVSDVSIVGDTVIFLQ